MSHDVYGTNFPTFWEFFGPIAVPVLLMLFALAAFGTVMLRRQRTPGILDAVSWLFAALVVSWLFFLLTQDEYGAGAWAIGFHAVIWIVALSGMAISLKRLSKARGTTARNQSLTAVGCLLLLLACALPMTRDVREAIWRTQCKNNLKQIGLALHTYHDNWYGFPAQQIGHPPVSWRVTILPYFDGNNSFSEYRYDRPWDGPENSPLTKRRMPVYLCPTQKHDHDEEGRFLTSYAVMYGPHGIWGDDRQAVPIGKIKDGTSSTIAVMEACGQNIVWTEPRDLDGTRTPAAVNLKGKTRTESPAMISSLHRGGGHVLLADGSVRFVSEKTDPNVLRALVTADGGETIGNDW